MFGASKASLPTGAPTDEQQPGRSVTARRRRGALLVAGFCFLASAVGIGAAQFITSPAERAAETAPPSRTLLTEPVESGVLTATIVARGTVVSSGLVRATPTTAVGAQTVLITRALVRSGDAVRAGQVLAEISGRPLIALAGALPAYRDLRPGLSGPDVLQLQRAMGALRLYGGGDPSGRFGGATAASLARLYARAGYAAPGVESGSPTLPVAEVVFIPTFPARVASFSGQVGSAPTAPLIEVSYGTLQVIVKVSPSDRSSVRNGLTVTLTDDSEGRRFQGTVRAVGAEVSADADGAAAYFPVTVQTRDALNDTLLGVDLLAQVSFAGTQTAVLIVPVSAISTDAAGETSVTVVISDGQRVDIPVRPGISANGRVQVTPVKPGALSAGMRVVTGDA